MLINSVLSGKELGHQYPISQRKEEVYTNQFGVKKF